MPERFISIQLNCSLYAINFESRCREPVYKRERILSEFFSRLNHNIINGQTSMA